MDEEKTMSTSSEKLQDKKENAVGAFLKKHWVDVLVICAALALLVLLAVRIADQFNFSKKWAIFWERFTVRNGYKALLSGMKVTALIAIVGLLGGIVIGTLIAVVKVIPPYKKVTRYAQKVCSVYVAFFRGTPIVVQLLLGYFILMPLLGLRVSQVGSCMLIFALNSGAYISEIMRGGISSVDPGQLEAARAVGMPYSTSMIKIVVPQAIKNILPTLGNEFIALVKETAVVGYVGAVDITVAFQYQGSNSYEFMIPYLVMAVLYIVIVAVIAAGIKLMERMLAKSERRQ